MLKRTCMLTLAALALAGCGEGGEPTRPSVGCLNAMTAAAAEPDPTAAEPLLEQTLRECSTVDEWVTSLRLHPDAMAYDSPGDIDTTAVKPACHEYRDAPVCRDAVARGIVVD